MVTKSEQGVYSNAITDFVADSDQRKKFVFWCFSGFGIILNGDVWMKDDIFKKMESRIPSSRVSKWRAPIRLCIVVLVPMYKVNYDYSAPKSWGSTPTGMYGGASEAEVGVE
ncbi:uncharacterized protein LOC113293250 isoform X2 [Papaver somniferum]|uniref:uncharacterized protein LOC113293250 isoform X2 n=1 Tax=Papaver somniferum TaxID=3469 RepID=UPI000E6F6027|nr:uncharacterized protein LOC113293250 isoform X2 [Papaver somniferum]XP_026397736.1 uncharacterized protein LOC113293250 isoform X2 [Papaver somniferum]